MAHDLTIEEIEYDELRFARINPLFPVDLDRLASYDAFILDFVGEYIIYRLIRRIRTHDEKAIYLKPIFLYKIHGGPEALTSRLADGIINNLSNPESIASITRDIKQRL